MLKAFISASVLLAGTTAMAQTSSSVKKYDPGSVVLSFEGGEPGKGIGAALDAVADLIPTRRRVVKESESICKVLQDQGYPPPCQAMIGLVQRLNPWLLSKKAQIVSVGDELQLPDLDQIKLRSYRAVRSFRSDDPSQMARGEAVQKSWSPLDLKVNRTDQRTTVDFQAYELVIPAREPDKAADILRKLNPLRSQNVLVDHIDVKPPSSKLQSDVQTYQLQCSMGNYPPIEYYQNYTRTDADLNRVLGVLGPAPMGPHVYLIDVPIKVSPNLMGVINNTPPLTPPAAGRPNCVWGNFITNVHHATHLGGIIAGRDSGFGFVGLAPAAHLDPVPIFTPVPGSSEDVTANEDADFALSDLIYENHAADYPLSVYLMAFILKPITGPVLVSGRLPDSYDRFTSRFERTVKESEPLLVVAAGQAATANQAAPISPSAPMVPQYLGDLSNVVVVTACVDCTVNAPTLMPAANFGVNGHYVHVAAPGGAAIPGWIDATSVGAGSGTSQAAAFVAGIAASMISAYPNFYKYPDTVKSRLQVTSWPIYDRVGTPTREAEKVATGVVDPKMALLDPSKHWLKDANGWREVKIKSWSSDNLLLQSIGSGNNYTVPSSLLMRWVRVSDPAATPEWIVYYDEYPDSHALFYPATIRKLGPLRFRPGPARPNITLCDGTSVPLANVSDLVISGSRVRGGCA